MAQQIPEITSILSNSNVLKILNQIIKRYNSLGSIYTFKGSVQTYDDLLAIQNPQIGDVYNVIQEDEEHQIAAGSNFVWDGTVWDNLGMGMDGLVKKINGFTPDDLGAVIFQYIKTIEDNDGTLTITVRNGEEESTLTIDTDKVKTVNGVEPDKNGNIAIEVPQPTIATQAEAEAQSGQNNTKFMTPLRVYQAIVAYFTQFLAAAVFTGIVKAVAPGASSNDTSVPTTSWVRTCIANVVGRVVKSVNGVVADSAGDVNLNFKFYNSFSQLGLTAATVTPKAIVDALPSNSMLVTFITTLTSSSRYTPNMELPANTAGLLIVIANTQGSTLPVKFELICQTGRVEKYIGRYITNGGVGFYGWRKPIVNDEMLLNGKLLSSLYDFASQAEAEAGNNTNKPMNALRVAQAISALAPAAVIIDSLTNRNGYFVFSNKIAVQWTIFSFPASVKSYTVPLPLTPKQVLVAIPVDVAGQDITVSYSLAWNFNKQTEVEFFITQAQPANNAYSCIVISKIE